MQEQHIVRSLGALAQTHRLRVFRLLVVAGPAGLTPSALAEALSLPAATLSFHLKELAAAGLISQERISRHLIYRADMDHMNALLAYLTENCCAGAPCTPDAASVCHR